MSFIWICKTFMGVDVGATLQQMRVFVAVVDEGGFAAAGDVLGMSQSSVSHTLATLERQLGAALVRRGPVGLTSHGSRLLPHARATLAAANAFDAAVAAPAQLAGSIRLAITPTVGHGLVPSLLALWRAHAPHVRVTLLEGDDLEVADWLESGAVDSAILIDPEPSADHVVVARDEFRAVVRVDHPLFGPEPRLLAELLDDPLLVSTAGCEPQIKELHRVSSLPYHPTQRVRELTTLMAMVEAGLGITVMPTLAKTMLPGALGMVPLAQTIRRTLVLAGPLRRPCHPAVGLLRDLTREHLPPSASHDAALSGSSLSVDP